MNQPFIAIPASIGTAMNIQHVLGSGELNSACWLVFSFIVILFFFFAQIWSIKPYTYSFPSHSFHFQEIVYDYDTFLDRFTSVFQ